MYARSHGLIKLFSRHEKTKKPVFMPLSAGRSPAAMVKTTAFQKIFTYFFSRREKNRSRKSLQLRHS
jgi:hypothetical protein